jgi:large-conductance mechanosensitive channel
MSSSYLPGIPGIPGIQGIPEFNTGLKNFIIQNNILTTMAAVTIAFSTGTFIRSFVGDIFMPILYSVFISRTSLKKKVGLHAFKPISGSNVDNFVKELCSWIFVILFTFLIIQYVVRRYVYSGVTAPAADNKDGRAGSNDVANVAATATVSGAEE